MIQCVLCGVEVGERGGCGGNSCGSFHSPLRLLSGINESPVGSVFSPRVSVLCNLGLPVC